MLYKYEFWLANGEERYLVTEMPYEEVKKYIQENQWIELNHYGVIYEGNAMRWTPKVADVQTCNIVTIVEQKDYFKNILENREEEKRKMNIIKEIEQYELSRFNKWRLKRKTKYYFYEDEKYDHPLMVFGEFYLAKILDWVKEKGRKTN